MQSPFINPCITYVSPSQEWSLGSEPGLSTKHCLGAPKINRIKWLHQISQKRMKSQNFTKFLLSAKSSWLKSVRNLLYSLQMLILYSILLCTPLQGHLKNYYIFSSKSYLLRDIPASQIYLNKFKFLNISVWFFCSECKDTYILETFVNNKSA